MLLSIVMSQDIITEITLGVAPHAVGMVRIVLRAVILDKQTLVFGTVVMRRTDCQGASSREGGPI